MNLKKELKGNKILFVLMSASNYNSSSLKIIRSLASKKVIYVTLNKTSDALKETFQKSKIPIKNILFIDAISKTFKKVNEKEKGTLFVSSPGALTEISLIISKALSYGFDYLIFDSLTSLSIYQKKSPVVSFISSLINKIKTFEIKSIFYSISEDELFSQSSMYADKVLNA